MSDVEALQGLWKIESLRSKGSLVRSAGTHYLFTGNSMKEIVPNFVSSGKLRSTFVVDESTFPKRLTTNLDYNGPDGPPDPKPIILRYLYQLDGEKLILCSGAHGSFPDAITEDHSIKTLIRDHGPIPEPKKPSGTPPLVDDLLGTLEWDDNLNWYGGEVRVENASIELSLKPDDGTNASSALARTKHIVSNLEQYHQMSADYAVDGLLELKNDTWREEDEKEVSAEIFKSRITLNAITVKAGGDTTFWFSDGGLFLGHAIEVCIDANDKCAGTDIPG